MSNHETIARPYAEALFAEALDRDQVDAWWPMIEALAQAALTGKGFLLDPRVQPSQKVSWWLNLI
jgi:F0F1-type ATP synthase delta subunit